MFRKRQNQEIHVVEKPKWRISMFGKANTLNSDVWKKPTQ